MSKATAILHTMRDDLHKGAPVPASWRRVVRECLTNPHGSGQALQLVEEAVNANLRKNVRAGFLGKLVKLTQLLFVSRGDADSLMTHAHSQLEQSIAAHLTAGSRDAYGGRRTVEAALANGIAEHMARAGRAMESHVASKDPRMAPMFASRLREAQSAADPQVVAAHVLDNGIPRADRRRRKVDFGADLRGPA